MTDRTCTGCHHSLEIHADGDEGYCRPCCRQGCSCTAFSDEIADAAAKEISQKNPRGKAPQGYCR